MCQVAYVEKQTVALAGAAGASDGRIHRDVVTRGNPGARSVRSIALAKHSRDDARQGATESGAVGSCRRSGTCAAARLDDAVEHHACHLARQDLILAADPDDELTPCARGVGCRTSPRG